MNNLSIPTPKDIFEPWGDHPEGSKEHIAWLADEMIKLIQAYLSDEKVQRNLRAYHREGNWPANLAHLDGMRSVPNNLMPAVILSVREKMLEFGWSIQTIESHGTFYVGFMPKELDNTNTEIAR